jgi:GTPase involved in cell partitioning and DNA repair
LTTTENYENRLWNRVNLLVLELKSHFDKTEKQEKQNKLSLTTRKKRKPVSSCRENAYKEKISTLILLASTTFLHFDSDKKKEKNKLFSLTSL